MGSSPRAVQCVRGGGKTTVGYGSASPAASPSRLPPPPFPLPPTLFPLPRTPPRHRPTDRPNDDDASASAEPHLRSERLCAVRRRRAQGWRLALKERLAHKRGRRHDQPSITERARTTTWPTTHAASLVED